MQMHEMRYGIATGRRAGARSLRRRQETAGVQKAAVEQQAPRPPGMMFVRRTHRQDQSPYPERPSEVINFSPPSSSMFAPHAEDLLRSPATHAPVVTTAPENAERRPSLSS